MEKPKKVTDKKQSLIKIQNYCAYQERSQQEVRNKLYEFTLTGAVIEELIAELIANNFLNEERFALAYAGGKFRMKNWGRNKIKNGLKQKQVPAVLIKKALASINADDYYQTLKVVLIKKAALINEKDAAKRKQKLIQYALGKGFESDIILDILNDNTLT